MTTLSRLHRKGLLDCRSSGRRFLYTPRLSSVQLELQFAADLVHELTCCSAAPMDQLVAAIVEAINREQPQLLDELRRALGK
jgi:predicted transcriptional regulator